MKYPFPGFECERKKRGTGNEHRRSWNEADRVVLGCMCKQVRDHHRLRSAEEFVIADSVLELHARLLAVHVVKDRTYSPLSGDYQGRCSCVHVPPCAEARWGRKLQDITEKKMQEYIQKRTEEQFHAHD